MRKLPLCAFAFLLLGKAAFSADFSCASEDTACLIAAIHSANANGEDNTIHLESGVYTLVAIDNTTVSGPNGLPAIIGSITIKGAGRDKTHIASRGGTYRSFDVEASGTLTLEGVTVTGFRVPAGNGSAIYNAGGVVNLIQSAVTENMSFLGVGGIYSQGGSVNLTGVIFEHNVGESGALIMHGGDLRISQSRFTRNVGSDSVAAISFNGGTAFIRNSTFDHNVIGGGTGASGIGVGGATTMLVLTDSSFTENTSLSLGSVLINSGAKVLVTNSTFARNIMTHSSSGFEGSAIENLSGTLTLTNSTLADNTISGTGIAPPFPVNGSALFGGSSATTLVQNTIIARNSGQFPQDCSGRIQSLGNNLIGTLAGCDIAVLPSDLIGDPGLGALIDDGAPGHGRFPLLAVSRAIDAGNIATCPANDQLGTPRSGSCDIGATEFYPVLNHLLAVQHLTTAFDPTPVSGGPSGTFLITADFVNTSNQAIVEPFVEVVELTGNNLLLNADGGPGTVGARLTPFNGANILEPGATSTFQFLIGLDQRQPFTFFVNVLGRP